METTLASRENEIKLFCEASEKYSSLAYLVGPRQITLELIKHLL